MKKEERFLLFIYSRISKSGLELKNILRESIRAESLRGGKEKDEKQEGERGLGGGGWVWGGAIKGHNDIDTEYLKGNSGKNPIRNGYDT
jgi:hypothetical protein